MCSNLVCLLLGLAWTVRVSDEPCLRIEAGSFEYSSASFSRIDEVLAVFVTIFSILKQL